MKKKKDEITIRSSAAEYLTYVASVGDQQDSIEMRYEDENIWLTQKMMATLYDVGLPTINEHIKKIYADIIVEGLSSFDIKSNVIEKNKEYTIYLKDGEEISKTLALLGANKSVLKFEEIRVKREMNNKVNRLVNCETANMNKTMNASIEQIEIIRKLKQNGKFEKLEEPLKEIAELRLQNPSASLIELGKMLKTPIGKSGVNYRLKKVMEIGKKIDDNKK